MMDETKALVPTTMSLSETMTLGKTLAESGYFTDARQAAQAVVKVLAGRELGFGPIASMTGIYVIQGRVSLSANLMAHAVKRSARYNYRVAQLTDEKCEIVFFEGGEEIGRSIFTKEDADKAGTKNMAKFPRNMLFARAMSNGVRFYCPDAFEGAVYTPEELGAETNEDGQVITVEPTVIERTPTPPPPVEAPKSNGESWRESVIKAIVDKKLAQNAYNATRMLALSKVITPQDEDARILAWAQLYREGRSADKEPQAAAAAADEGMEVPA
jgi:hypothetical protein